MYFISLFIIIFSFFLSKSAVFPLNLISPLFTLKSPPQPPSTTTELPPSAVNFRPNLTVMSGNSIQYPTSGSPAGEQDRFLPIANVSRIMKRSLPANAKISKEAKETVQECVSEFISFITGEASDKCQREKRKTINGDDLLWAMTTLGFQNYVAPLKNFLNKYRETEEEKHQAPSPAPAVGSGAGADQGIGGKLGDSVRDFQDLNYGFYSFGNHNHNHHHGVGFGDKPLAPDFYIYSQNTNGN